MYGIPHNFVSTSKWLTMSHAHIPMPTVISQMFKHTETLESVINNTTDNLTTESNSNKLRYVGNLTCRDYSDMRIRFSPVPSTCHKCMYCNHISYHY